jgi:hypothetical protein
MISDDSGALASEGADDRIDQAEGCLGDFGGRFRLAGAAARTKPGGPGVYPDPV